MARQFNKIHYVILGIAFLLIAYALLHDPINGKPFDFGILQWIILGVGTALLIAAYCGGKLLNRIQVWIGRRKPQLILCTLSIYAATS